MPEVYVQEERQNSLFEIDETGIVRERAKSSFSHTQHACPRCLLFLLFSSCLPAFLLFKCQVSEALAMCFSFC